MYQILYVQLIIIFSERVIECIRQRFGMIGGPLPLDYLSDKDEEGLTKVDKMLTVACTLNNLCDAIVPFD